VPAFTLRAEAVATTRAPFLAVAESVPAAGTPTFTVRPLPAVTDSLGRAGAGGSGRGGSGPAGRGGGSRRAGRAPVGMAAAGRDLLHLDRSRDRAGGGEAGHGGDVDAGLVGPGEAVAAGRPARRLVRAPALGRREAALRRIALARRAGHAVDAQAVPG